jgi:predicted RNA methylase
MQDLEIAKKQLYSKQLTLAIVKNNKVLFQTDSHRISGFIHAIDTLGMQLNGASVADRVAGKALALLCVYSGIREVYAEVLSEKAQALFKENEIACQWEQLVENVLDLSKTGVCPFEKTAAEISKPQDSYPAFKALLEKMKPCK